MSKVLGEGSFGVVVKGIRVRDNKPVAGKILKKDMVDDSSENEWKILESIKTPFLLNFITCFQWGVEMYIVSELCDSDLRKLLQEKGTLSLQDTKVAASHLSRGYTALQTADIVHRDIKPENIFVEIHNGGARLKLADFGYGKITSDSMLKTVCGTKPYMAPEVWDEKYDSRADVWSMGLVLYECFFGLSNPEFFGKILGHKCAKRTLLILPVTSDVLLNDLLNRMIQPDYNNRLFPHEFYRDPFHKDISAMALIRDCYAEETYYSCK